MILVGSKWSIYSGDVNQDGVIDIGDVIKVFNDAAIFASGNINTDLNGDGLVDISDVVISYNNSSSFVQVQRP